MSEIDWTVLARYLANECAGEERVLVDRWLAEVPERRAILTTVRGVASDADRAISAQREAELLASLRRNMAAVTEPRRVSAPRRQHYWPTTIKIAAAVALLLGGSLTAYRALGHVAGPAATAQPSERIIATRPGQRVSFHLSDGTHVILGAASTLRQSADFGRGARPVVLEGEAYFEVVHDGRRPFTVRAGDLVTKDLGTEFTIRAYRDDVHARVVVRAGQVAIQSATSQGAPARIVEPGQLGTLDAAGKPAVELADTAASFGWTTGRLLFRETPLRDAVIQMNRWYGIDVHLASPELGSRRLTASFDNQRAADALRWVATVLDLELAQAGGSYTFRAK